MKQQVGVRPRLELDGADYGYWRKATWGIDLEVTAFHSIEHDNVGLKVGPSEHRALVLERPWAGGAATSELLSAVTSKQEFTAATVEVADNQGQRVAMYELARVLVGFLEHEITLEGAMLERIGLRYLHVSFST